MRSVAINTFHWAVTVIHSMVGFTTFRADWVLVAKLLKVAILLAVVTSHGRWIKLGHLAM
jgi:hypothetical protein